MVRQTRGPAALPAFLPDTIMGDLDSLQPDVRQFYQQQGHTECAAGLLLCTDRVHTDFVLFHADACTEASAAGFIHAWRRQEH